MNLYKVVIERILFENAKDVAIYVLEAENEQNAKETVLEKKEVKDYVNRIGKKKISVFNMDEEEKCR